MAPSYGRHRTCVHRSFYRSFIFGRRFVDEPQPPWYRPLRLSSVITATAPSFPLEIAVYSPPMLRLAGQRLRLAGQRVDPLDAGNLALALHAANTPDSRAASAAIEIALLERARSVELTPAQRMAVDAVLSEQDGKLENLERLRALAE